MYGDNIYFGGDPFHEGGQTAGIDVTKAASEIYRNMNENNLMHSQWVLQAWQNNPRRELLAGISKGDAVVLDLWAESGPQWGGVESSWKREEGFLGHDWVWCSVPNFGGNVGMYGKLGAIAHDVSEALHEYAHKEWAGLLTDFYLPRWEIFIRRQKEILNGHEVASIDWYAWEEKWTKRHNHFASLSKGDPVLTAAKMFEKYR